MDQPWCLLRRVRVRPLHCMTMPVGLQLLKSSMFAGLMDQGLSLPETQTLGQIENSSSEDTHVIRTRQNCALKTNSWKEFAECAGFCSEQ